ncbi:sodium/hydrogen exchanger 10 isoform X1 [Rattus norvegicus]|nr:sodium/hydrogen exchanger 10 [Rattus norvegicus]XP_008766944.1 sodium/hydrogen exchanger 10 isoform X1 [Rattus norvegicus]XP_017453414.1 sodium/hydrogen exchanger 10 isoform X1 [Rattus norvegicus]XP_017453415.1 sodium/hydrogen exchanger 10 isoform X1 [Rattus norvegicus]XP_017453416.1 sodium/hydrogen exchanger 10 isoform X1 [Rattus norvegicus]|eukprot:NP_001008762.2 sodium/hydrogen exchanger 10 [Rattus norvegicus]
MEEVFENLTTTHNVKLSNAWLDLLKSVFLSTPQDLPEIILILSLICTIGAFLNMHLKDFPIPLPVILFLIGCCFEILSFASTQIQLYADAIQWMDPDMFFGIFTPVIIFNVAFDMDIYMLQKLFWQILLITIPGFMINYTLILWYLQSVNKLSLKTIPWLLFSAVLISSDPMLTSASIRDLGLSRSLTNLINGESLLTSVISLIIYSAVVQISFKSKHMNHTLAHKVMSTAWSYLVESFITGILITKAIQLWMATIFGDDVNHITLIFSVLYLIFYVCELIGMSGIFTLATIGLFLNSTSFKPGVEAFLLEFWNCLSFIGFLMVFTFIGLLIPAHTYLYISFSDVYYSLNIYFTLIVLRLLVFLLMSPILSRLGHGFSWRWAFIMVWSEMKGTPNINMALLLAYSDVSLGSERERSQILFHGVSVCVITLIVNRFILPMAVIKLGLRDVTSTKYKSVYYTFQHFQELTKSTAMALKFDKDLANADWNMVDKAIILQNPYALNQEETTEHQKVKCPDCNKEIDETLNIEAMELANRRLLSAQIASYQRQYRNEILSQSAMQVLVGAAGSFGEKKGEYMSPENIKNYSESKKLLSFLRKLLLNWVYNTKKDKGVPSRYMFLHACHSIVFTNEFEYTGYIAVLMNTYPMIICWISRLKDIYQYEIKCANYYFLTFYILEALLKVAAMRKEFFSHTWLLFELGITLVGILDIILIETDSISYKFDLTETVVFMNVVRLLRILRILKLITPKLLQVIDKRMSQQISFRYAILKGYVQGEMDVLNIIDQIASSKQAKQILLKRVIRNMDHAMKELGYLEYDHPEIAVTMKTKEEVNVMLNMAREIVKAFRSKGIIHKVEGAEINKLIMAKKKQVLELQSVIQPLNVEEAPYYIPWLSEDPEAISFIQEKAKVVTFDCGNNIFEEGDEPEGIYVIISGMVKLKRSKPHLEMDRVSSESEVAQTRSYTLPHTEYLLSGEIIGELNCLTKERMQYSATCKTVVETYFIPISHLYEGFEKKYPNMKYKMWQKIGLAITAQKIRENLSFEDWNYKMQLKLCNVFVRDIPKTTKTDIYDETVTHVVLIHGSAEDCQLRKIYKAPFLIPVTCHQIQGLEEFTKVMIIQTSVAVRKFRWNVKKYNPPRRISMKPDSTESLETLNESSEDDEDKKENEENEEYLEDIIDISSVSKK